MTAERECARVNSFEGSLIVRARAQKVLNNTDEKEQRKFTRARSNHPPAAVSEHGPVPART
jgi:hypothetical protein